MILRLIGDQGEILIRAVAEITLRADGDLSVYRRGSHVEFQEDDLLALVAVWRRLRKTLGRAPLEWPETNGRVPRWARHR